MKIQFKNYHGTFSETVLKGKRGWKTITANLKDSKGNIIELIYDKAPFYRNLSTKDYINQILERRLEKA